MHEFSIVQNLLHLIEDHARQNHATRVTRVVVQIGKFSGVEPHLLKMAFDTFKAHSIAADAELEIQIQDLELKCQSCKITFTPLEMNFTCPRCQSQDVEIIHGREMLLLSLELEQ